MPHFFGTAFFVGVEADDHGYNHPYLVTARHNIRDAEQAIRKPKKWKPDVSVRINSDDGKARIIPLTGKWHYPANDAVDLAAMSAESFDDDSLAYTLLPMACSATNEKIRHHGIGPGSAVLFTGLFSLHEGTQRNLPIVRQGIIASMIEEPLRDEKTKKQYDSYLLEALSTFGMSGSPVLVKSNRGYVAGEDPQCPLLLLGTIRGHFRAKLEGYPDQSADDFHAGLSTVVPVNELHKLLNEPTFLKQRQKEDEKRWAKKAKHHINDTTSSPVTRKKRRTA